MEGGRTNLQSSTVVLVVALMPNKVFRRLDLANIRTSSPSDLIP
jgi:hypothetical protein